MYTIFIFFSKGGIKAVIWTDVIQYWIMLASVLAILIQVLGNFGFFLLETPIFSDPRLSVVCS